MKNLSSSYRRVKLWGMRNFFINHRRETTVDINGWQLRNILNLAKNYLRKTELTLLLCTFTNMATKRRDCFPISPKGPTHLCRLYLWGIGRVRYAPIPLRLMRYSRIFMQLCTSKRCVSPFLVFHTIGFPQYTDHRREGWKHDSTSVQWKITWPRWLYSRI